LKAVVDTHIRINISNIDSATISKIKGQLTFPNPEKETARKQLIWGWEDLDSFVYYWQQDENILLLPRGFADRLNKLVPDLEWIDNRVYREVEQDFKEIVLRDYQERAVDAILITHQGIVQAPTGSGKTVLALEAFRRSRQRTLVLVNSRHIAKQWRDRCEEHLGFSPGMIGEGEFSIQPITIAINQTLWSRRDKLSSLFWNSFGFVCVDECHHAPANTFKDIIERFPAAFRIGISATPNKSQMNPIAQVVLGEIFHQTTDSEVGDKILMPSIEVVNTNFTFNYQPTFKVKTWEDCPLKGCNRKGYHIHRNNYQNLLNKLKSDEARNALIAEKIGKNRGHGNIVLSRSLDQIEKIRKLIVSDGWPEDKVFLYTGKQSGEERNRISTISEKGDIVILTTVGDEALDIPRLDRAYLAWPTKNPDVITQQIGRVKRNHPDKEDAVVYDFVDDKVGVLKNQYNTRKREVYSSMNGKKSE
jgi:superfamily II DNA or RNA helicase